MKKINKEISLFLSSHEPLAIYEVLTKNVVKSAGQS